MDKKPGLLRRLYDWMLRWAESPYGTWALFVISFAESSFFPIPPDPLLVALCLGAPRKALWFALVCSVGSILGGLFGYLIGATLWEQIQHFMYDWIPGFSPAAEAKFRGQYEEHGFWIVLAAGFTPIPYKVVTILSGAMSMPLVPFAVASALSRSARFFLVAGLIRAYGEPIKHFIEKYFDVISLAVLALGILGFVVLKVVL